MWFRISSVGFDWQNVIYNFVTDLCRSRQISDISICRDQESDNTEADYFYKAKDDRQYYHMPIQNYLAEKRERSPIIDADLLDISRGVYATLWLMFQQGVTYFDAIEFLREQDAVPNMDFWPYFIRKERDRYCVESSEGADALNRCN